MTDDARAARRVRLGDQLAVVFEDRETLAGLSAEPGAELQPDGAGLLATLYLDVAQAGELARVAAATAGVESALYVEVAGSRVSGTALTAAEDTRDPAGAWAVWFPFTDDQRRAWLEGADVAVGADRAGLPRVPLTPEQRRTIAADL